MLIDMTENRFLMLLAVVFISSVLAVGCKEDKTTIKSKTGRKIQSFIGTFSLFTCLFTWFSLIVYLTLPDIIEELIYNYKKSHFSFQSIISFIWYILSSSYFIIVIACLVWCYIWILIQEKIKDKILKFFLLSGMMVMVVITTLFIAPFFLKTN